MELMPGAPAHWAALMALDSALLERASVSQAEAGKRSPFDDGLAEVWLRLMRGDAATASSLVAERFAHAAATGDRFQVIEVTALRALIALSLERLPEAVSFARRASLMARTEGVPPAERLANVVLARVRRYSGKPYLAVRILDALIRVDPHDVGWLEWERVLAGGVERDRTPADASGPAANAASAARELLLAAEAGDRSAFDARATELEAATAGFHDVQAEALALITLLDPERRASEALAGFRHGVHAELRHGLFGASVCAAGEEPGLPVYALARPGERGRRVLRSGLGLFGPCRTVSGEVGARRTRGRTDAGLCALLLAGPEPIAEDEFWRRVYGFNYAPATHRGVLDVLVHRMRARLGPSAQLARHGRSLGLELGEPMAIADPLCASPAAARILSALARQPLATADALADRLGITVRAAQMALHDLVQEGVCAVRRSGRQTHYQLEDSTFSEPTGMDVLGRGAQNR